MPFKRVAQIIQYSRNHSKQYISFNVVQIIQRYGNLSMKHPYKKLCKMHRLEAQRKQTNLENIICCFTNAMRIIYYTTEHTKIKDSRNY